jgi:mannose-6-phosphate isomerase-like protein (cupin superfamily)
MALTFIRTSELPRIPTPQGEATEILNPQLCGAKNVLGTLRWLKPGETFQATADGKHQLIYLMGGTGTITLETGSYDVKKGSGLYLGPNEAATIQPSGEDELKFFQLIVPEIPR